MKRNGVVAKKILSILMYAIPVVFFAVMYFLMVVTGEDIWQGAGTGGSILSGAGAAFEYNARLSDMYAWGVIRIFDYTFSFGIDTIVRVLDVLLGVGIVYLAAVMVLGRRPKLQLKDALLFCVIFLAIILGTYTSSLMIAWSHIHNYLIIGFFSMMFALPFMMKVRNVKMPESILFKVAMLVLGFLFGFSSNVTPIAFLIAFGCILAAKSIRSRKIELRKIIASWELMAIVGVAIACVCMYVFGQGIAVYEDMNSYAAADYVSFGELIQMPVANGIKIVRHIVVNITTIMPWILLLVAAIGVEYMMQIKKITKTKNAYGVRFVGYVLIFVLVHVMVMSQVEIGTLKRLLMPAYFMTIVGVLFTTVRVVLAVGVSKIMYAGSVAVVLSLSLAALADMTHLKVRYHRSASQFFERVRSSDDEVVCVTREHSYIKGSSHIFGFNVYPILQDWTMEKPIYDKTVRYCEEMGLLKD